MLDFVLSVSMLVVLAPLFVVVAIVIKIDSPGPVLFLQERVGRNGRVFRICKFRSMAADNDMRDTSCEDRYTRVGGLLRRTSIDELPQLLNVMLGQMSFIGPRPWVEEYWNNMNERERERAKVRPGITGLAAAKGRNGLSVFEKIGYDLEYVRDFGFFEDVKVVFLTVKTVISGEEVDAGKSGIQDDIGALKAR
ncbi:sugar transferase [Candidatus Saccharibacteria bacterium]|nr:sugar transferase [Candidatus Saccharibacteria bacterium]